MAPPTDLTGVRAAVLRSALVGVLASALAGLVLSLCPGHEWQTEVVDPTGIRAAFDRDPAGGPLLMIALAGVALVAALGIARPRREVDGFVGGALTMLALPLVVWLGFSASVAELGGGQALWASAALEACVGMLVLAGPAVAVLGYALFRLEARAAAAPVPIARLV